MRTVLFFVFLFCYLLCKGHDFHNTGQSKQGIYSQNCTLSKPEPSSFMDAEPDISLIEELDLYEAPSGGHHLPKGLNSHPGLLFGKWYFSCFLFNVSGNCNKDDRAFLFFYKDIFPIYLRQRVLKI